MPDTAVDHDFEAIVARHRTELGAHCYRMLGSPTDAEDALQESLTAAWRGRSGFQGRSSVRTWLFQIATNACLKLAQRRPPRMLSFDSGPARTDVWDLGEPVTGPVWVEPWTSRNDPESSYLQRESLELAYVAALQHLPPTQRAVLMLREVLEFSAAEVAAMLSTTVPSVNSALQRARSTLGGRRPAESQQTEWAALGEAGTQQLVSRFVAAWEAADVPALLELLTDDVRFTMPPLPAWFDGRNQVSRFLSERVAETPWRLTPTMANEQPALICYQHDGAEFRLGAFNVLHLSGDRISWIAGFVDPVLLREAFGFPEFFASDR